MSAQEYKIQLFASIQDLLWAQWTALGIPGQMSASAPETVLDPEALLLFSAGFARYDQRLYDLILDWLQVHSSQINIQRLKALHGKATVKDTASLGYMAAVAAETDPSRWKKPAEDYKRGTTASAALFRDQDDVPQSFIPTGDKLALDCGFSRNRRRNSEKIPAKLPNRTAALLLRMRGLLGISARAETILILLTSTRCTVQDIVDRSGFSWKSVQDVLEELAAGGYVSSVDGIARGKVYLLNSPEKLRKLFDVQKCLFPNWSNIFDSIGLLWQTVSNPNLRKVSAETFQNELRRIYRDELQTKFLSSGHAALGKADLNVSDFPKSIRLLGK
jgi:hypothetical protein